MARVAILGARGIGKHHAKWFHHSGAEVVACLGTCPDTAEAAAEALRGLFPFCGKAYHDLDTLLAEASPDILAITCPPQYHLGYVDLALERGLDVWCEKPLHFREGASSAQLVSEAEASMSRAREANSVFGLSLQYVAAADWLLDLYRDRVGKAPEMQRFEFLFESVKPSRAPDDFAALWIDLGPHQLALLQALAPGGKVAEGSLRLKGEPPRLRLDFDWVCPCQPPCAVSFELATVESKPRRQFGFDGLVWEYQGRSDASGVFRAILARKQEEVWGPDFLDASIKRFLAGAPYAGPDFALANTQLLLGILDQLKAAGL